MVKRNNVKTKRMARIAFKEIVKGVIYRSKTWSKHSSIKQDRKNVRSKLNKEKGDYEQ